MMTCKVTVAEQSCFSVSGYFGTLFRTKTIGNLIKNIIQAASYNSVTEASV